MGEYDRPAKIVGPDRLGCGRACEASFAGGRAIPARIGVSDLGGERKGSRGNQRSSEAQFRACEGASGYGPAQVALRGPAPGDRRRGSDRGHSRRIHVSDAVLASGESASEEEPTENGEREAISFWSPRVPFAVKPRLRPVPWPSAPPRRGITRAREAMKSLR